MASSARAEVGAMRRDEARRHGDQRVVLVGPGAVAVLLVSAVAVEAIARGRAASHAMTAPSRWR